MQNTLKMLLLVCALLLALAGMEAVTVSIGTGTANTANFPITAQSSFSYSQQIYTKAQINQPRGGSITSISFYCASPSYTNSQSWTVYLGHTTKTSFTSTSNWEPVANLTQVYNGDVTFANGNWMTITLSTPFIYNNTNNLLVAVDENTSGNAGAARNFGSFTSGTNTGIYRTATSNINPSSPGRASGRNSNINRIQFVLNYLISDPASLNASAANENRIDLSWVKNAYGDNVLLAWSPNNTFGTPLTGMSYSSGSSIPGGGTVLYNGNGTSFSHTQLIPNTRYYYKLWSYGNDGISQIAYSPGISANVRTPFTHYLITEDFSSGTFPPSGWTRSATNWSRVSSGSTPTASPFSSPAMAQFNSATATSGTTALLISPQINIPADGYSVSFRMYRDTIAGNDKLNVYLSATTNTFGAYTLGTLNRNNSNLPYVRDAGWYRYTIDFPAGYTGNRYVIFEGVSARAGNIY